MAKKKKSTKKKAKDMCCKNMDSMCNGGGIYCLGFLGAAIYYISTATGFWIGVWGVIKAIVWPAFLVFELFKFLQL